MSEPAAPIPAATLVVMRQTADDAPELLMVERAATMAFAGGALVFPGGRIDYGDRALAAALGGDADDLPGRVAAIRETIEETGLAVGLSGDAAPALIDALRAAFHRGAPIADALAETGLTLDVEALIPFARWRPRHIQARIFDTRFYLAKIAPGASEPRVDATENVRAFWITAQDALDAGARGDARIIFPTRRNLERLARFGSFAEAITDARAHPVRTITPWTEQRDGVSHLCIPDDLGYPLTSEPLAGVERF